MKNMYAVKCLYKITAYNVNGDKLDYPPVWEERIFLVKANDFDDADKKYVDYAYGYETEYKNENNEIIKIELSHVVDMFQVFDTTSRNYIEVYSNLFSASEEDVEKMLDIQYPIEEDGE